MATVLVNGRRNGNRLATPVAGLSVVRCAVYCRQSVSEGNGESASIGVQRESCLAFIAAHAAEGWTALPEAYADQGISGATLQRPAMQRLLADVAADRVDAIVTYKIDRLSRNLVDFVNLVDALDRRGVRLVSISQSFDTRSALGRLTLGLLMSFAEFERSLISERTRDAVAAARRKGRWTGGCTPWGYTLVAGKLVPDPVEAHRVAEMFAAYLRTGSLIDTAAEANWRGWRTKVTATRDGRTRGGVPWSKSSVHRLLTNPLYAGRILAGEEAVAGEHEAIVGLDPWQAVQERLSAQGGPHTTATRYRSGALLAGVLFCGACGAAMTPSCAVKRAPGGGQRRYAYYRCSRALKMGRAACPSPHVSAPAIEGEVVAEIARVCRETPGLVAAIVAAARSQLAETRKSLRAEARALTRALRDDGPGAEGYRNRLAEIERETASLAGVEVEEGHVGTAVGEFHGLWAALTARERRRVVEVLVERVTVGTDGGPVTVTLREAALPSLAPEVAVPHP